MGAICADDTAPTSVLVSRLNLNRLWHVKIYFIMIPDMKRFINRFP
jgi:hypothetical protein